MSGFHGLAYNQKIVKPEKQIFVIFIPCRPPFSPSPAFGVFSEKDKIGDYVPVTIGDVRKGNYFVI